MNELDSKTLLKLLIPAKVSAILMLLVGIYVFSYDFWRDIHLTNRYTDLFLVVLNDKFGIFNSRIIYHLIMAFLLAVSFLPTDVDPRVHISTKTIVILLSVGSLLFFFPFVIPLLYAISASVGFMFLLSGFMFIRTGMFIETNDDEFNMIQESFSQFEKKLENKYSVNLQTYYFLKNNKGKLEKRHGWINIVNPFRACLVMGTPGSGKSFCFINPAIEQMMHKRFAMFLYDFKFPTLSVFAYNHFLVAREEAKKEIGKIKGTEGNVSQELLSFANAQAYVLNFDSPAFSHGANPLNAKFVKSDTDARDAAETIMLALNPESRKHKDFFLLSAVNLVHALIMWLQQYKNGKYCTFAHMVELLNIELDELFPMLMSVRSLEAIVKAFADAFREGAMDQLQGQVASAKMPLVAIAGENMWWICSQENFEIDVNDPFEPKLLCIGNNPEKKETYAPLLSLYTSQVIKQINKQGKLHSAFMVDELPTIFINGLNNLIATARSNRVGVYLGIQDNSQLEVGYGKERANEIINTIGNFFSGQVQGDTAKFVSSMFGKNLQKTTSHTISADGTVSKSINETRDLIIPESKVSNLTQGFFVGRVADDFDQPIDKKLFHCKVDIDTKKLKDDESQFVDIPILTHFDKASANPTYMIEFLNEFNSRFENNREVIYMMEEIMRLSNEECVYELNINDFMLDATELSYSTLQVIKLKLNVHDEYTQETFEKEIKRRLVDFYIKQLMDYDFLQSMGKYKGNKNRYYVTVWMKAHVRANYYKIKDDINKIKDEVVEELLKSSVSRALFREEYLEKRQQQMEEEAENRYGEEEENREESKSIEIEVSAQEMGIDSEDSEEEPLFLEDFYNPADQES